MGKGTEVVLLLGASEGANLYPVNLFYIIIYYYKILLFFFVFFKKKI